MVDFRRYITGSSFVHNLNCSHSAELMPAIGTIDDNLKLKSAVFGKKYLTCLAPLSITSISIEALELTWISPST